jgi:eukaryotic-like serine/threonine-protein kinase
VFVPGDSVGNYEVIRRLSSGGMATLYLAKRKGAAGFARPVALKVIHPHLAEKGEFSTMFVDEANISARINHPNVVHVEELGQIRKTGTLFLAMEYVEGRSVAELVRALAKMKRRMSPEVAVSIAAQVAAGLHAAHEVTGDDGTPLDVVHRDVTPHNVLVSFEGHVKVIDFGIAKSSQRLQSTTREGVFKGKVRFMSPEQAWAKPVDRRSDVFSLGIVLWELLTLKKLFDGPDDVYILHQLREPMVEAPSKAGAACSPALDAVVLRALSASPDARPPTAQEFRRLLLEALPSAQTIDIAELGALMRASFPKAPDPAEADVTAPGSEPTSKPRSHSVAPPSSVALAASTVEDPQIDVDDLFSDGSAPSSPNERSDSGLSKSGADLVGVAPKPASHTRARGVVPMLVGAGMAAALAGGALALRHRPDMSRAVPSPSGSALQPPTAVPAPAPEPTCGQGMVKIPAGSFFMGSDDKEDFAFEKPAHKVTLSRAFCMDVYEVTTADYKAASDSGVVKRAGQANDWEGITADEHRVYDPLCNVRAPEDRGRHPINCVSWELADAYCTAMKKHLPTEAEWEYAARGPDGRKYPWGDEPPNASFLNACGGECKAWGKKNHADPTGVGAWMYPEDDGWAATAPVGSFPAGKSRYGVNDVVGNVWEWVADWYAPYTADEQADAKGPPSGDGRVARGGAWNGAMASWVRPTFRFHYAPAMRSHGIGFRCASAL